MYFKVGGGVVGVHDGRHSGGRTGGEVEVGDFLMNTMNTTTTTLWRLPCHRSQQEEEGKDELGGGVKETEVIHDMADEQQVITEK